MTGLRARQKLDRNNRILEAAAELFKTFGYEAVKMEAIAATSEVSIGTIYNYYQNKGDLLLAIASMEVDEVLSAGATVIERPPRDVGEAIEALISIYIDDALVYLSKEMWRVAMSMSTQQPSSPSGRIYAELDLALTEQTCALIVKLQQIGLVRKELDAIGIGELLFNNINMMFTIYVKSEEMNPTELRSIISRQIKVVIDAIKV
jgi:AcrR family transcriptional regulator